MQSRSPNNWSSSWPISPKLAFRATLWILTLRPVHPGSQCVHILMPLAPILRKHLVTNLDLKKHTVHERLGSSYSSQFFCSFEMLTWEVCYTESFQKGLLSF